MSVFEIILAILLVLAAVLGFIKGIAAQIGSLVGIVLGIIACRLYGQRVVELLAASASSDTNRIMLTVLAYVLLFVAVYLVCLLLGRLLRSVIHSLKLGIFDRIAGALFKAFLWFFCISLLLNAWVAIMPQYAPQGPWAQRTIAFAPAVVGSETATELLQTTLGQ